MYFIQKYALHRARAMDGEFCLGMAILLRGLEPDLIHIKRFHHVPAAVFTETRPRVLEHDSLSCVSGSSE